MNWGHPGQSKVLLLTGDCAIGTAAVLVSQFLFSGADTDPLRQACVVPLFVLVHIACFYVFDLYDLRALNGVRTVTRLFIAGICGSSFLGLFLYAFRWLKLGRGAMMAAVCLLLATSLAWRHFFKIHSVALLKARRVFLVGTLGDARNLGSVIEAAQTRYALFGFAQLRPAARSIDALNEPVSVMAAAAGGRFSATLKTGTSNQSLQRADSIHVSERVFTKLGFHDFGTVSGAGIEHLALRYGVDTIVLREHFQLPEVAESLTRLRFQGIRISTMPDLYSQLLEELPLDALSDSWFSFATGFELLHQQLFRKLKRLSDIAIVAVGLLITLPLSMVAAIAIKIESPGPVLFRQKRVGWKETTFTLLKFRSMRQDAESNGVPQWAAEKDPRATRVGRILRTLHIDEIPQMINVLMGEMSFVGPRPERPSFVEQLKKEIPFYSLRHHVPPGITGWAQVNYPYGASVQDAKRKLQFDLYYVRNASPTMDLRILLRTARVVLFRRGSR